MNTLPHVHRATSFIARFVGYLTDNPVIEVMSPSKSGTAPDVGAKGCLQFDYLRRRYPIISTNVVLVSDFFALGTYPSEGWTWAAEKGSGHVLKMAVCANLALMVYK